MIQPTIKEKMEIRIDAIAKLSFVRTDTEHFYTEYYPRIKHEMEEFARLICEEMTGKEKKYSDNYGIKSEDWFNAGNNLRVEEEKQKAQEILKALE